MFSCTKCGLCCRNVSRHSLYLHLDRGDGTCQHFDEANALCSIYDNRPEICRVDLMYDHYFSKKMMRSDFYGLCANACNSMQAEVGLSGFTVVPG